MTSSKRSRAGTYVNLQMKAEKEEYELQDPLDYLILDLLPDEGTMFAGLYPLGESAKAVGSKFTQVKGGLTATFVSTRFRRLHAQGLVVFYEHSPGSHGQGVWQRSKQGAVLLAQWKKTKENSK